MHGAKDYNTMVMPLMIPHFPTKISQMIESSRAATDRL